MHRHNKYGCMYQDKILGFNQWLVLWVRMLSGTCFLNPTMRPFLYPSNEGPSNSRGV